MKDMPAIAAVLASLGMGSPVAHAQRYFVNGRAGGTQNEPAATDTSAHRCSYVLDVKLRE